MCSVDGPWRGLVKPMAVDGSARNGKAGQCTTEQRLTLRPPRIAVCAAANFHLCRRVNQAMGRGGLSDRDNLPAPDPIAAAIIEDLPAAPGRLKEMKAGVPPEPPPEMPPERPPAIDS